jgi:hypothetical protein
VPIGSFTQNKKKRKPKKNISRGSIPLVETMFRDCIVEKKKERKKNKSYMMTELSSSREFSYFLGKTKY